MYLSLAMCNDGEIDAGGSRIPPSTQPHMLVGEGKGSVEGGGDS